MVVLNAPFLSRKLRPMRIFGASSPHSACGGHTVASMPNARNALSGYFFASFFFVIVVPHVVPHRLFEAAPFASLQGLSARLSGGDCKRNKR